MMKLIGNIGDVVGGTGVLICLAAGLARLGQTWSLAGVQVPALFQLGMALMVAACLAKLHVLVAGRQL